jgi:hypothetical protein
MCWPIATLTHPAEKWWGMDMVVSVKLPMATVLGRARANKGKARQTEAGTGVPWQARQDRLGRASWARQARAKQAWQNTRRQHAGRGKAS